jgi:hypothetical protein
MSFTGSTWVVENRNISYYTSQDYGFNLHRTEQYVNGIAEGDKRMKNEPLRTPSHFGYPDNTTLFAVFENRTTYLLTTENGKQGVDAFPQNVKEKVCQFTPDDFSLMNADTTANKLYVNKELECWLVGESLG